MPSKISLQKLCSGSVWTALQFFQECSSALQGCTNDSAWLQMCPISSNNGWTPLWKQCSPSQHKGSFTLCLTPHEAIPLLGREMPGGSYWSWLLLWLRELLYYTARPRQSKHSGRGCTWEGLGNKWAIDYRWLSEARPQAHQAGIYKCLWVQEETATISEEN